MHLKINPKRVDFDVHPKSTLNAGIASSKIACLSTRIFGRASLLGTNMEPPPPPRGWQSEPSLVRCPASMFLKNVLKKGRTQNPGQYKRSKTRGFTKCLRVQVSSAALRSRRHFELFHNPGGTHLRKQQNFTNTILMHYNYKTNNWQFSSYVR